ncbi:adenylosuccinate lyase [Muribaculum sp. An289]|uniref:adenylosuccinate lyase n=1 Tax=unclassified Muribaculum TaxID=2622126 RepID=UPI000B39354A|nr:MULTISPECIES: adenylosuccinate lyase [unclassified Muribaculum]OUO37077.1 adenylosuccinate lyase [Muribaculum sp. An289]OUO42594.1 adenylosuccinate lyase [Muribaculum sp. An287]
MTLNPLTAVSPIDGRYAGKTAPLREYFSEFALIRNRVKVEIEYFISLTKFGLSQLEGMENAEELRKAYTGFTIEDAGRIKEIEKTTNHDVKAVEYFIKEKFREAGLERYSEFVHFGLTSQDINNTATPLSVKEALHDIIYPKMDEIIRELQERADEWKDIPMLARTHGQPASPTRLGKEIEVFVARLREQKSQLESIPVPAKFGGATGNMNAHKVAFPDRDWKTFADSFVAGLGLKRSCPTTQIEHYDNLAAIFDAFRRFNTILIDLCRDIWTYISMEYFRQRVIKGEVGSSAMPHKVNPIDFENAEGNLGMADAIFTHLSMKLPVSRLQRDLTDSTVLRNIGVPFGHSLIAFESILKGLGKLLLNREAIDRDLENNWAVVAEAIQTVLRREAYPNPYEALKALTRTGGHISQESIAAFIDSLDVDDRVKEELHAITPMNYTGI